jgi:hypothetical protein
MVLGGSIACLLSGWLAPGRAEAAITDVRAGHLTVLSDVFTTLPSLPRPVDGRLRGYAFAAEVTGDRCAAEVSGPGEVLRPPAGDDVCAFVFSIEFFGAALVTDTGQSVPGFAASVHIGRTTISIPSGVVYGSSDEELAVAVPNGSSADLVMSAAGYRQDFSLTTGKRTGPSPAALYRSPASDEVSAAPGVSSVIAETAVHGGEKASVRVTLSGLSLGFFMPGDPLVRPTSPNEAFLGCSFAEKDLTGPSGVSFSDFAALPGSAFRLVLPDGTSVPGTLVLQVATGLVANEYVFTVPASLTAAELELSPGTRDGFEDQSATARAARASLLAASIVPVRFGTGSFPVTVPDPLPTQGGGGGVTTTSSAGTSSTAGSTAPGSQGTTPVTTQPSGRQHERQGQRHQGQRAEGKQHSGGPVGSSGTQASVVSLAAAAGSSGAHAGAIAGVAAGGTTLIVIPLVIVLRRRRRARRLFVRFPRPRTGETVATSDTTAPGGVVEAESAVVAGTDAREAPGGSTLSVRVLGPVEVEPLAVGERRSLLEELCSYLALHPERDVSADELCTMLGGVRRDWSPATLYKRVSALRRAIGPDVLVRSKDGGYRLEGDVACDWFEFLDLTKARPPSEEARLESLQSALGLVRGAPFAGAAAGRYGWAGEQSLVTDMTVAIESAAMELAEVHLARRQGREALAAIRAGLKGSPYSFGLLALLLRAGALDGTVGLERAWREVCDVLGEEDESLLALRRRLDGDLETV